MTMWEISGPKVRRGMPQAPVAASVAEDSCFRLGDCVLLEHAQQRQC